MRPGTNRVSMWLLYVCSPENVNKSDWDLNIYSRNLIFIVTMQYYRDCGETSNSKLTVKTALEVTFTS